MKARRLGIRAGTALVLTVGYSLVSSQVRLVSDTTAVDGAGFIRVGHDNIVVDSSILRYTGMVASLGSPSADGKVYSFAPSPVGARHFPLSTDDLRGWRLTMLSGKRFAQVFRVRGNTSSEITVTADAGALDDVAVSDLFIIESVDADGASMFGPPYPPSSAPSPGV